MLPSKSWVSIQKEFPHEFKKRYRRAIADGYYQTLVGRRLLRRVEDYVLRGGKRLRPYLLSVGAIGGKKIERRAFWDYAIGIELIHAGMLVHDDIMDNSPTRRGKPSMHVLEGKDRSIVIGDVAWSMGFQFLLNACTKSSLHTDVVTAFLQATVLVAEGQVLDLDMLASRKISKKKLYTMYALKTASYTCVAPLVMGALASNQRAHVPSLQQIGHALGVLFQFYDDVRDFATDSDPHLRKVHVVRDAEAKRILEGTIAKIRRTRLPSKMKDALLDLTVVIAQSA